VLSNAQLRSGDLAYRRLTSMPSTVAVACGVLPVKGPSSTCMLEFAFAGLRFENNDHIFEKSGFTI